jgi:hypothetical protein
MSDRPGKKMGEYAVRQSLMESMQREAPDEYVRQQNVERAAQAGREAEAEVKRETRGTVKKAKGGKIKSASARADGCAIRGKTRGKIV